MHRSLRSFRTPGFFLAAAAFAVSFSARATAPDSIIYSPGLGTWGTMLFEDSWPNNGDLDFNDENFAYNYELALNASGQVTALDATFNVLSVGATFHNGLYLHLPGISASSVQSAIITTSTGVSSAATQMPGEGDVVIQVINDTRSLFEFQYPFINTQPTFPAEAASNSLRVQLIFNEPIVLDTSAAPYDLFIARSTIYDWQIHRPMFPGTSAAASYLSGKYGTANDCSSGTSCASAHSGTWFVNHSGLPFALDVPELIDWPKETVAIDEVYPDITLFGTSGGAAATNWYSSSDVNTSYAFTQGAVGTYPPSPVFVPNADLFAQWVSVSSGLTASFGIQTDGTLWGWGSNQLGQLGFDSSVVYSETPLLIGTGYKQISSGADTTLAVKSDGTLWAFGDNTQGQIGDGTTTARFLPEQVGNDTDWVSASVGYLHSVALKSDGTAWTWGYGGNGELGNGSNTASLVPIEVGSGGFVSVSAGQNYSLGLQTGGTLWAWGFNSTGQLGDGTTTTSNVPIQVGTDSDWAGVVAGYAQNIGVKTSGALYGWGYNRYGEAGVGSTSNVLSPEQIGSNFSTELVAGESDSFAIDRSGNLWGWGQNGEGEIGNGSLVESNSPAQASGFGAPVVSVANGFFVTYAVTSDGRLWQFGLDNPVPQPIWE